jgi:hypothetical protein
MDESRSEIGPHETFTLELGLTWSGSVTMINITAQPARVRVSLPPTEKSVEMGMMEAFVMDLAGNGTLEIMNGSGARVSVILRRDPI